MLRQSSLVTPLGLARVADKDDEYRGYFIPKGITVFPNVWCVPRSFIERYWGPHFPSRAVLHDPCMYPDPLRFNPDRFADEKRNRELGINELPRAVFGFGRR